MMWFPSSFKNYNNKKVSLKYNICDDFSECIITSVFLGSHKTHLFSPCEFMFPEQKKKEVINSCHWWSVFHRLSDFSARNKKPCVQYLPQEKMIDSPGSSHGSMLDSPATPSAALASPAAPAPTHSEQAQPLSLTTKPDRQHHYPVLAKPPSSSSSSSSSGSQLTPPLLSRPLPFSSLHASLLSPPSPYHHSHHALFQSQPLSLVTKSADWLSSKAIFS